MSNFTWDLEGLISINDLKEGDPNNSNFKKLLNVIKKTEKYTRACTMMSPVEFTTTNDIYKKFGLLGVSFNTDHSLDSDVKGVEIYDLVGSFDMSNHFKRPKMKMMPFSLNNPQLIQNMASEVFINVHYTVIEKGNSNPSYSYESFLKLYGAYSFENLNEYFPLIFNYKLDLYHDFDKLSEQGLDFLSFVKQNNISLNDPVYLKVKPDYFRLSNKAPQYYNNLLVDKLSAIAEYIPLIIYVDMYNLCEFIGTYDRNTVNHFCELLRCYNIKIYCYDLKEKGLTCHDWLNMDKPPYYISVLEFDSYKFSIREHFSEFIIN